jgi:galactonate dehydratase
MKITKLSTLICDAGWRPWTYSKIETDEGITGWGEFGGGRNPYAILGCLKDLEPFLIGRDPRAIEKIIMDINWVMRNNPGGIAQKAVAAIDLALWDIKGKALGVPVYELFGGPTRTKQRVYWSHCGTSRARHADLIGKPPIRTWQDITNLGKEVASRGFTAFKTNIVYPGDPARVYDGDGGDRNAPPALVNHVVKLISTFREAVGDEVDILLDLNFNFRMEGFERMAKALEPYNLLWLEVDIHDPQSLLQIKESTTTRICSCETIYTPKGYRPYFELHAIDSAMIDVPWNGFTASKKIADMADTYEINVAPHNYYSHLSTLHSANLCASIPNVRIMEIDIDDVPWKNEVMTNPPVIENGHVVIPTKPGWGSDINEAVVAKHPWPK